MLPNYPPASAGAPVPQNLAPAAYPHPYPYPPPQPNPAGAVPQTQPRPTGMSAKPAKEGEKWNVFGR
jgi:hypothetical protein